MNTKFTPQRFFWTVLLTFLAACAPTTLRPTETAVPSAVPPTQTATATFVIPTPSPFPTRSPFIPIMTPDAIQVARWKEYQTELAKRLVPQDPPGVVLCEWIILGRSGQEIYVAAVCSGSWRLTAPAVIYLAPDGAIQNVEAVDYGSSRDFNIQRLFPPNVQEMIYSGSLSTIMERLEEHLDWRLSHREEPPLIALSASPTATPAP